MKYPILIQQTNRNTVIAICPLLKNFYSEGDTVEVAIEELERKFICYLHDENIQLEIISIGVNTSATSASSALRRYLLKKPESEKLTEDNGLKQ